MRITRDDPGDLFNRLADAGQDRGIDRATLEAELDAYREYLGTIKSPARRARGKADVGTLFRGGKTCE